MLRGYDSGGASVAFVGQSILLLLLQLACDDVLMPMALWNLTALFWEAKELVPIKDSVEALLIFIFLRLFFSG